jgi:hypothetical protein
MSDQTKRSMRVLLDQRAQQTKRRNEPAGNKTSNHIIRQWIGPKRGGSMRGRRNGT